MPERTPWARASYDAVATTWRGRDGFPSPPTTTGRPASSGRRRTSTAARNWSRSTCRTHSTVPIPSPRGGERAGGAVDRSDCRNERRTGENRRTMRDVSDDIKALRGRLEEAQEYLRIDDLRARRPQLETEASRPDLWDDADVARKVTGELSQVSDDLDLWDGLAARIADAETLAELAREE